MEPCAICLETSDQLHRVCKTCQTFCHSECFHQWCITDEALVLKDFLYHDLGDGFKEFTQQSSRCFACRQPTIHAPWSLLWTPLIRNVIVAHLGWMLNCALFVSILCVGNSSNSYYTCLVLFASSCVFSTIACIDHLLFVGKRIRVYR